MKTAKDNKKKRIRYFRFSWALGRKKVTGKNGKPIFYDTFEDACKDWQKGEQVLKEKY